MAAGPRGAQAKVLQYETFVSDVLQRDLRQVLAQREEVYGQLAAYLQLKNVLERLQESGDQRLRTQVDLGCNFYVNAEVPDPSRIFVALGYGFFLELTLMEALKFIDRKSHLLTSAFGSCRDYRSYQMIQDTDGDAENFLALIRLLLRHQLCYLKSEIPLIKAGNEAWGGESLLPWRWGILPPYHCLLCSCRATV
ncbi:protein UXT isoform X1 [Phascolarctos cinereus]